MSTKAFQLTADNLAGGYFSQKYNRKPSELAPPSKNVRMTLLGGAYTRPGYDDTGWDFSISTACTIYRHKRYAVTWIAGGTSLKYRKDSDGTIIDTGISLTSGTTTTFAEYLGDIYITNATDGIRRLYCTTLNGAVASADTTIVLEAGSGIRAPSSGNIRINGTNIAYTSVTTDTLNLTTTAGAIYATGEFAIAVHSLSSLPKGSKIEFWKESMNIIGVTASSTSDASRHTHFWGKFAAPTTWEAIYDFTIGAGSTAGYQLVGKTGVLTNMVQTRDYLYLFKEDETYYCPVSGVSTSDGGARPAQVLSTQYGCASAFAATDMAGYVVWLTKNKRIIKSNVRTQDASSVIYPDEAFDVSIRDELNSLDDDQSGSRLFYWKKGKLLFCLLKMNTGQRKMFIYDNNLGIWLPPDTNKLFNDFTEINGDAYATSDNDDTVYKLETGTSDNGADIECIIAGGAFRSNYGLGAVDWSDLDVSGYIRIGTTVSYISKIDDTDRSIKTFNSSSARVSATAGSAAGDLSVGDGASGGGAEASTTYKFYKKLVSASSPGREWQPRFQTTGDGQWMEIDAWTVNAIAYSDSLLTLS